MTTQSLRQLDSLADRIRLHRQADKNALIIVEGGSDERFLQRAFPDLRATYFPAGTRGVALTAATQLKEWGQTYSFCVVDRDFDTEVEDLATRGVAVHPYENADLEAMVAIYGAGASLLDELGSKAKIEEKGGLESIIQKIYGMVAPITILRRANVENNWGLAFDKVDIASKVDKRTLSFKLQPYCAALSQTSGDSPGQRVLIEYATGRRDLGRCPECPRGSNPYFRGRDFIALLSAALCSYCGSKRPQSVEPDVLESVLRLSGGHAISKSQWGEEFISRIESIVPS